MQSLSSEYIAIFTSWLMSDIHALLGLARCYGGEPTCCFMRLGFTATHTCENFLTP